MGELIAAAAPSLASALAGAALLALGRRALALWRGRAGGSAEVLARLSELSGMVGELSEAVGRVTEAQHVAMRQQLLHNAEKYIERGWLTPEERQAWFEMFVAYGMLGQNGFIQGYWDRLENLPDRQI